MFSLSPFVLIIFVDTFFIYKHFMALHGHPEQLGESGAPLYSISTLCLFNAYATAIATATAYSMHMPLSLSTQCLCYRIPIYLIVYLSMLIRTYLTGYLSSLFLFFSSLHFSSLLFSSVFYVYPYTFSFSFLFIYNLFSCITLSNLFHQQHTTLHAFKRPWNLSWNL